MEPSKQIYVRKGTRRVWGTPEGGVGKPFTSLPRNAQTISLPQDMRQFRCDTL